MSSLLREGASGDEVVQMQTLLKNKGFYKGQLDGLFGPATEQAVVKFQKASNLLVDGIAGEQTLRRLKRISSTPTDLTHPTLTEGGVKAAADRLGVHVAAIKAFSEVESAGHGFLPDGRAKILFEQHWMYRLLKKVYGKERADTVRDSHGEVVNPTPGNYAGGSGAWDRFEVAAKLDRDCAIQSCSYGRYQLMGFHWENLGYDSPSHFFDQMMATEDAQLEGIVRFIEADKGLLTAIRENDWAEVARRYNGRNYHINKYDVRLAKAYGRHVALTA